MIQYKIRIPYISPHFEAAFFCIPLPQVNTFLYETIFVILFLLPFSFACEAPYDDANPDVSILNRVWVDHYRDQDGVEIRHTLIFYQNGRGEEYIWDKRYSEDWEEYYTFYWSWEYNHTRIRLEYDDFELLFTNVYVTSGSLSGLFDGVSVNFTFNQVVSP